tara:strand:- start:41 stop:202 length:162 start_codon:yes stop_codon:yes gene_type:complete
MNIESATYVETGIKTTVKVVADGVTMFIPIDIENIDYQALQEWVADGNTIAEE